jgi:transposase-like protein
MGDHGRQRAERPPFDGFERSETPSNGGDRSSEGPPECVDRADPEVAEKPLRRRFTAAYKLKILQEADACTGHGEVGALLRREGLYSSHLRTWKQQRAQGALDGLAPKKRGRKAKRRDPLAEENERLRRKNAQLKHQLRQAETIIDVQKKLCTMLGLPDASGDMSENEE